MPAMPPAAIMGTTTRLDSCQETHLPILAAWMGIPVLDSTSQQSMPNFLPRMVQLSNKVQRTQVFAQETRRFTNKHADVCTGFAFPAGLAAELHSLTFSSEDVLADWHKGLGPGVAMLRDRSQMRAHRRTLEDIEDWGTHIQFNRSDRQKLEAPTPVPPATIAEFLPFLKRYHLVCQDWLGDQSFWTQVTKAVHEMVQHKLRHIANPDAWCRQKGPHIIWQLTLEARDFFGDKRDYQNYSPVATAPSPSIKAHSIVSTEVDPAELPSSLSQLLPLPAMPAHGIPSYALPPPLPGGRGGASRHSPGTARRQPPPQQGRGAAAPPPAGPPTVEARVNSKANRSLVELFADLQLSPRVQPKFKRTVELLKEAETTVEQAQQMLGLPPNTCFNFHIRGTCRKPGCTLDHTEPQHALLDNAVAPFLAQLQTAVDRIKAKRQRR